MSTALLAVPVRLVRRVAPVGALALALALPALPAGAQDDEAVTPARVAGENPVETAANIATLTYGQAHVAHLVVGGEFPDALAASYAAGVVDGPILLPAAADDVGATTWNALEELDVQEVRLVGGDAAVSPDVAQHYRNLGYEVERIAGPDRYGTTAAIADQALLRFGFSPATTLLARGDDYPDTLAASIDGAVVGAPILLTPPEQLSPHTADWFARACPGVDAVRALGGDAAVSEHALAQAVAAAQACEHDDDVALVGQPSTDERVDGRPRAARPVRRGSPRGTDPADRGRGRPVVRPPRAARSRRLAPR